MDHSDGAVACLSIQVALQDSVLVVACSGMGMVEAVGFHCIAFARSVNSTKLCPFAIVGFMFHIKIVGILFPRRAPLELLQHLFLLR